MATTDYPVNHPLAVKLWAPDLMTEALKRTSFLKFMGKSSSSLCQIKTELNKSAGDRIRFGLRMQLRGDGVQGDSTLEGNEEDLVTFSQDVFIDQLRHAVRSGGKMSEQRVPFSVRAEARDGLADWWSDRLDSAFFNQLAGMSTISDVRYTGMQAAVAPDTAHWVFANGHTAESSLSATTTMNLPLLDVAVEIAKTAQNALRPLKINGDEYWVAFLHPFQTTDLRRNTSTGQWLDIQKAAMMGGNTTKNPIFTGALGMYNNIILQESVRIPNPTTSVRRAVLCGAQAACIAYGRQNGQETYTWVEELFDYKNQLGVAAGTQWGLLKTRFNNSDFATVAISTWAAQHTS